MSNLFAQKNKTILLTAIIVFALLTILVFLIDPLYAGMSGVILGAVILTYILSEDAAKHLRPIVTISLSSSNKILIFENNGTSLAYSVQITLPEENETITIGDLAPDSTVKYQLKESLYSGSIMVTWRTAEGKEHKDIFSIGEEIQASDPFRPMFPIFSWKNKKKE